MFIYTYIYIHTCGKSQGLVLQREIPKQITSPLPPGPLGLQSEPKFPQQRSPTAGALGGCPVSNGGKLKDKLDFFFRFRTRDGTPVK